MAQFKIAYEATAAVEGGYANNPSDNGGETYKGVARNSYPKWGGWPIIDSIKRKLGSFTAASINREAAKDASLQALVLYFYETTQWDKLNLDLINNQSVANELYDTAVNMGLGTAGLFFQRVLNVVNLKATKFNDLVLDGQVGPRTVAAFNSLNTSDQRMVWKLLNCLQGAKYIAIAEANKSQEIFMRSWSSRVFES